MNSKLSFSPKKYSKLFLPYLLVILLFSLLVDLILFLVWLPGVSYSFTFYWNIGFLFFFIINTIFLKAYPIARYLFMKNLRKSSYVQIEENIITHYVLVSRISRRRLSLAIDTILPNDGKKEYITSDTYKIYRVNEHKILKNGSIFLFGDIEKTSLYEGLDDEVFEKSVKTKINKHKILGYYVNLELIENLIISPSST